MKINEKKWKRLLVVIVIIDAVLFTTGYFVLFN